MLDHPPRGRESISWSLACAWALVIYTVVPYARSIQTFVSDHWGRRLFTHIVLAVIVLAVAKAGLLLARRRPVLRWWNIACLGAVALAYAIFAVNLRDAPEEALHLVEYGGLSLLVFKDAQVRGFLSEEFGLLFPIAVTNPQKNQQTFSDAGNGLLVDGDAGFGNSLDEEAHGRENNVKSEK